MMAHWVKALAELKPRWKKKTGCWKLSTHLHWGTWTPARMHARTHIHSNNNKLILKNGGE